MYARMQLKAIVEEQPSVSEPQISPLACPQCRQVDLVQKVTAVVDAGTSATVLGGSSAMVARTIGSQRQTSIGTGYTRLTGAS